MNFLIEEIKCQGVIIRMHLKRIEIRHVTLV